MKDVMGVIYTGESDARLRELTMTRANQIWTGTFDADQFAFGSFKTPEPEEMNADEVFAEAESGRRSST